MLITETKQRKNGTTRKQKTASPGVEPVLSARALNQTFDKFLMVTSTGLQPLRLFGFIRSKRLGDAVLNS